MRISDWSSDVCSSDLESSRHDRVLLDPGIIRREGTSSAEDRCQPPGMDQDAIPLQQAQQFIFIARRVIVADVAELRDGAEPVQVPLDGRGMPFEYLVVRSRGPGTFDPELRDQAVIRKVHIPALKDQVTQGRDEGRFQELLEPLVPRRIECVAVEMERIVTIHGTKDRKSTRLNSSH